MGQGREDRGNTAQLTVMLSFAVMSFAVTSFAVTIKQGRRR
jgi:hypothetical protein